MVDGDERRECQPPRRAKRSARQDIVAGLQPIDEADEREGGEKTAHEQPGYLAPDQGRHCREIRLFDFHAAAPTRCAMRGSRLCAQGHTAGKLAAQALRPTTWSLSLTPV